MGFSRSAIVAPDHSASMRCVSPAAGNDFLVKHRTQTCLISRAQPNRNGTTSRGASMAMRSKGGRTIKLSPVDEDSHVTDHPARAGLEAIMDQKLFHQRIKSERSAAYWFAA